MNHNLKSLINIAKVSFVGIMVQIILTILSIFILNLTLPLIFPSQIGGMLGPDLSNVWRLMNIAGAAHFVSTGIASFICGYLIFHWNGENRISVCHSIFNGFVVGSLIPFVLFIVLFSSRSKDLFFVTKGVSIVYYGGFGSLTGTFGYYFASRRYRQ